MIIPPSSSVAMDESNPLYGCRSIAFWIAGEKKFLVHTGDKLAINKAFLTVFQNSSKEQWEQVHLLGGVGDAESGRQVLAKPWPPSAETLATWPALKAPDSKKKTRKRKVMFTPEQIDSAADAVHGFKKVLRPRLTGKHAGKNDVFYVCKKTGHICRSIADIERHLNLPVTKVRKTRAKPKGEEKSAKPAPALFGNPADKSVVDTAWDDDELMKILADSETEDEELHHQQSTTVASAVEG